MSGAKCRAYGRAAREETMECLQRENAEVSGDTESENCAILEKCRVTQNMKTVTSK